MLFIPFNPLSAEVRKLPFTFVPFVLTGPPGEEVEKRCVTWQPSNVNPQKNWENLARCFFSRKTKYGEERWGCKKFTIFFGGGAKNGENILRDIVRVSFPSCWFLRRFSLNFFFSVELIPSSHCEVNMQRKIYVPKNGTRHFVPVKELFPKKMGRPSWKTDQHHGAKCC